MQSGGQERQNDKIRDTGREESRISWISTLIQPRELRISWISTLIQPRELRISGIRTLSPPIHDGIRDERSLIQYVYILAIVTLYFRQMSSYSAVNLVNRLTVYDLPFG